MAMFETTVKIKVEAKNAESAAKKVRRITGKPEDHNWFKASNGTMEVGEPVKVDK